MSERFDGLNSSAFTPRPQRFTFLMPCDSSSRIASDDGARLSWQRLWMLRVQSQASAATAESWYLVAKPATSVWYRPTAGTPSCIAENTPAPPSTNGLAR